MPINLPFVAGRALDSKLYEILRAIGQQATKVKDFAVDKTGLTLTTPKNSPTPLTFGIDPKARLYYQNATAWFNVISFGADPLGVGDSTQAIRDALAAAIAAGGGVVYFPRGVYLVTSTIVVGSLGAATRGISFIGDGGSYSSAGTWTGSSIRWGGPSGTKITDAAMALGSTTLTSASNPFTSADVGKYITVTGAAAGGGTLSTTIAAYVGAGNVTLTLPNASGGAIAGKTAIWNTVYPVIWCKNLSYSRFEDLSIDGSNCYFSAAFLWDNDGTAGASTSSNVIRNVHVRRTSDGICIGSLPKDAYNNNQVDTLLIDRYSAFESIASAEGSSIFLNCPNATGIEIKSFLGFQWRYGVRVKGDATHIGGGFSINDSVFGGNGALLCDFFYVDTHHGIINIDNCEAENLNGGKYLNIPSGGTDNLYWPITIKSSNTTTMQVSTQTDLVTIGNEHAGVLTFDTKASRWTSISDTFNGGAPSVAGGTVYTRQDGAGLGTLFSGYVPPMGFTVVGTGGGVNNATNAYVDVTGCTVTFTPPMACRAMINTSFDTAQTAAGGDICIGTINVNGTDQTPTTNWSFNTNGFRSPMTQQYAIDLTGGTAYTIKARFKCAVGGATTFTVYPTNTTMNITLLGKY